MIGLTQLQCHALALGIFLHVTGEHKGLDDTFAHRHRTMGLEQGSTAQAQRLRQTVRHRLVVDGVGGVQHRHGVEQGALCKDRRVGFACHAQIGRPFGMGMHDGTDIAAGAVDTGVQMELQGWLAGAFDHLALHVDGTNVLNREARALARPDIDEHAVLTELDAAVPVVIDDIGLLEHSNAVHKLLFECQSVLHGMDV